MDRFENIKPFRIRIFKTEKHRYSEINPNPDWERLGFAWLKIADGQMEEKTWFKVAYIPHDLLEISYENHCFYRVPNYRDLVSYPNEYNLVLGRFTQNGTKKNLFRLYARTGHPSGPYGGKGEANIDLSPTEHLPAVLFLLKNAEKIFSPKEIV